MKARISIGSWGILTFAMFIIYGLSIGPAYNLAFRIRARPGPDLEWPLTAIQMVYAPVGWIASATKSTDYLRAYVEWWMQVG